MQYRHDIDGLRAVAVLSVVIFHAFPSALPGGFVGVDVFFVISGYLITGLLLREHDGGRINLLGFYARRARRIFPALVLVLLACLGFGWSSLMPAPFAALGWQAAGGAGFVSNVLLAGKVGYFDQDAAITPLLHLWSLAIEEQFYLLWPVALILLLRSGRPRPLLTVGYLIALLVGITSPVNDPEAAYFSTAGRAWQLLTGAGLAFVETGRVRFREVLSWAGAAMVGAAVWTTDRAGLYPGMRAMLPTFGAALLIAAGPTTWLARILSARPMVAVGLISFPLYLWHWPALVWLRTFHPEPSAMLLWSAVLLSVGAAAATYLWVERPIRSIRLPVATKGACAALFCAGMAGLAVNASHGVPQRFPVEIRPAWVDPEKAMQAGKCLVMIWQKADGAFADCGGKSGTDVALFGDSHAAVLYQGLSTLTSGVGQFTSSSCPPWRGIPHCDARVGAAFSAIRAAKPKTVVMHAYWREYGDMGPLVSAVAELRGMGVERVVVVGPVPVWPRRLDYIAIDYWKQHGTLPPERMPGPDQSRTEAALRQAAQQAGAAYVSAQEVLCNEAGCLVRLPGETPPLAYFDSNHLSESGAKLLVGAIWPHIASPSLLGRL